MKDVTKKDKTELQVLSLGMSEKHGKHEVPGSWSEPIKKTIVYLYNL